NIPQVIRPITERLLALTSGQPARLPPVDEAHVRRVRFLGTARLVAGLIAMSYLVLHAMGPDAGKNAVMSWVTTTFKDFSVVKLVARANVASGGAINEVVGGCTVFAALYLLFRCCWWRWDKQAARLSITESNQTEIPFNWRALTAFYNIF